MIIFFCRTITCDLLLLSDQNEIVCDHFVIDFLVITFDHNCDFMIILITYDYFWSLDVVLCMLFSTTEEWSTEQHIHHL